MYETAHTTVPALTSTARVYEIAAFHFPDDVTANVNAASAVMLTGDLISAWNYLRKVEADPRAWNNMGVLTLMEGNPEGAAPLVPQSGRHRTAESKKKFTNRGGECINEHATVHTYYPGITVDCTDSLFVWRRACHLPVQHAPRILVCRKRYKNMLPTYVDNLRQYLFDADGQLLSEITLRGDSISGWQGELKDGTYTFVLWGNLGGTNEQIITTKAI